MLKVNRLDGFRVLGLISKNEIDEVFLDIDYTVLNFGKGNCWAIKKLNEFSPGLGNEFKKIFDLNLKATRKFSSLSVGELNTYQKNLELIKKISVNREVRIWARSLMIMVAAKKLGLKLSANEIKTLRNVYWESIAKKGGFYEDALPFLDKIKSEGIKITWVTASDSVLIIRENTGEIELKYGPQYSRKEKAKRLVSLLEKYPGKLVIGDPIDKPEIWEKVLEGVKTDRVLVSGDSYDGDIKPAEKRGIKTILISR